MIWGGGQDRRREGKDGEMGEMDRIVFVVG